MRNNRALLIAVHTADREIVRVSKTIVCLALISICLLCHTARIWAQSPADDTYNGKILTKINTKAFHHERFRCDSVIYQKVSDNRGEGIPHLQGVRNLRVVLPGILYRSGGNNLYNPLVSRHNNNPLSFQTVLNLWEMGFDEIVYLYKYRFDSLYSGELAGYLDRIGIRYSAVLPMKATQVYGLLKKMHLQMKAPRPGYILIHCWNGWHMSGLISAFSLMQFCGYDADQAWNYWKSCTDGNHKGYERLRDRIRSFKPFPDLILTDGQKQLYCPCENN